MRRRLELARAAVFAGEVRVWRAAAFAALPLAVLAAIWCLVPRDYYTGTDNVETYAFIVPATHGDDVCVPGLRLPAGTGRVRLQLRSATPSRPALALRLRVYGSAPIESALPSEPAGRPGESFADFPVPPIGRSAARYPATLCLTSASEVSWGGTPLPAAPGEYAPTKDGSPIAGRIAVWYLPPAGSRRSYLSRASEILRRASLFRPGLVGPWLYALMLLVVLPALALLAVRCLAVAAAARDYARFDAGRAALLLYVLAAVNFACWSLITPAFQAPDEVDHFAYTQSLVERGASPSPDPASKLARWSTSEALLLESMGFNSDHQVGDTKPPWELGQERRWRHAVAERPPSARDGGGTETAATHGPAYYAAIAPAYLLASSSPVDQLTLMRLASALLGALTALFAFQLARELVPRRPWVAVLAGLMVVYQPMYGFISGSVNNDVGVNAGAAAAMLLLIRLMRRGWTPRLAFALGATLLALPAIKQTAFSLYPVAGLGVAVALWRHRRRSKPAGYASALAGALLSWWLAKRLQSIFHPAGVAAAAVAGAASSAVSEALAHPLGYLAYLWEVFLPRLPFMARHFTTSVPAGYEIFIERGFGAFGWYDVLFPAWLFELIFVVMVVLSLLGLRAAARERAWLRAHAPEAIVILLAPLAVVAGVEAAFYTTGVRPVLAEFGRYVFPAIAPLAVIAVGCLHGLGRRLVMPAGAILLTAMIALCGAGQLLTLTGFYA